jgi:sec-independent protein translocase protein TatB
MLDIGWSELGVIAVVALLVIGPKDLPKALYTVGKWVRTIRRTTADFQRHVDDMVRQAELDEVRKGVQQVRSLNVKQRIEKSIDPTGEIASSFEEASGTLAGRPAAKRAEGRGVKSAAPAPVAAPVPAEGAAPAAPPSDAT